MKKKLPVIIVIIIFIAGISVCLYPIVANYINQKNESHAVENMKQAVKKLSPEQIKAEKAKAVAYNKKLLGNHLIITDPFNPNAKFSTDKEYFKLLNISDSMASISIPKINVNLPIYHGTSKATLEKGVGHLRNTSLPVGGISTHSVLSAHTGLPTKKLFTDLDKMAVGDIFYIYVLNEKLSYEVDQIKIVKPDVTNDLVIYKGHDYVTLITCTPYGKNTHRLLVRGTRIANAKADKIVAGQSKKLSLIDKLLMRFGISIRELIVFAMVAFLIIVFIVAIIILKVPAKKKKGGKNEEKKL